MRVIRSKRQDAKTAERKRSGALPRKRSGRSETITLLRAEFEALVQRLEDAEDTRDLRSAVTEAESRTYLPSDAVERMIEGEHPVRIWREQRGLTLADLAAKAAMQVGYLSEIEIGKKPGSVRAYRALAGALGLTVDDLLPGD